MTLTTLLAMRHGKSDWNADYGADRHRPLNERGRRAAASMGTLITTSGLIPDVVLTSPAVRAARTAELAAASGDWGAPITVVDDFYGGGVRVVLSAAAAARVPTVLVVGHQPVWSALVEHLTGARAVMMPTAAVAAVDVSRGLDEPGTLLWHAVPRLLAP